MRAFTTAGIIDAIPPMFGTENLISKVPQYSGVTWPSPKGSGGSKAIPCVIHQTAKTHTLKETCCNW